MQRYQIMLISITTMLTPLAAAENEKYHIDSVSLEEALNRVISSYPAISEAKSRVESAKTEITQVKSQYYPFIDALVQYTRIDPVSTFSGPGTPAITLFPANNYNIEVSANLTILDFRRRSLSVKISQLSKDNAINNQKRTKLDLALQTVEIFNLLHILQLHLSTLDTEYSDLKRNEHTAQVMVESGTVTQLDVLTMQVRITAVENARVQDRATLKGQAVRLIEMMGLTDSIIYASGDFYLPSTLPDGQSLLDTAFNRLPEVSQAHDAVNKARFEKQLALAEFWPQINANASYGFKNGYVPHINQLKANWLAGVSLSLPVFDGFARLGRNRQAADNLSAAQSALQTVERTVRATVLGTLEDLKAAWQQIPLSLNYIEQARKTLLYAEARYKSGNTTILELLDAESALAQARFKYFSAQYETSNRWFTLKKAVGMQFW